MRQNSSDHLSLPFTILQEVTDTPVYSFIWFDDADEVQMHPQSAFAVQFTIRCSPALQAPALAFMLLHFGERYNTHNDERIIPLQDLTYTYSAQAVYGTLFFGRSFSPVHWNVEVACWEKPSYDNGVISFVNNSPLTFWNDPCGDLDAMEVKTFLDHHLLLSRYGDVLLGL